MLQALAGDKSHSDAKVSKAPAATTGATAATM
jgi:hypothetical protein